jgi:hypothetical protein
MVPGNHDRTTRRSFLTRRFEGTFGEFMPSLIFPWLRWLDDETAILGLDPTRTHSTPRGRLPEVQLETVRAMAADPQGLPKRLIIACHYPVAAPAQYQQELQFKRMDNGQAVSAWLAGIGPHIYCCGHVHAAWAFQPPSLPNQLCLNAGAPLMSDPTGLRLPGFLEIDLQNDTVTVTHQAWSGAEWKAVPMLANIRLTELNAPAGAR